MSRGKLLYMYDPWCCNFHGVAGLEEIHDVSSVCYMGWHNLLTGLSEHDERNLFGQVNRQLLERIIGVIDKERYDAIIIDGRMAFVLGIGNYLLEDVLERSPSSLDGTIKDIPLVVANPVYRHDIGLHGSGCDFGIREGVDATGAIDGLLQDPMRMHPAIVYNEDLYREESGLILPR